MDQQTEDTESMFAEGDRETVQAGRQREELELWQDYLRGNPAAMSALFNRLEGILRSFTRARVPGAIDADNLATDTLRKLLVIGSHYQQLESRFVEGQFQPDFLEELLRRMHREVDDRQPNELADSLMRSRELKELVRGGGFPSQERLADGLQAWRRRMLDLQVRAWLFRAVKNRIIDLSKASTGRQPLLLGDQALDGHADPRANDPALDPEDDLRSRRLLAAQECVEDLPDPDRRMFHCSLTMSYAELAKLLETTVNAVGTRLTRLRKSLKMCVEGKVRD